MDNASSDRSSPAKIPSASSQDADCEAPEIEGELATVEKTEGLGQRSIEEWSSAPASSSTACAMEEIEAAQDPIVETLTLVSTIHGNTLRCRIPQIIKDYITDGQAAIDMDGEETDAEPPHIPRISGWNDDSPSFWPFMPDECWDEDGDLVEVELVRSEREISLEVEPRHSISCDGGRFPKEEERVRMLKAKLQMVRSKVLGQMAQSSTQVKSKVLEVECKSVKAKGSVRVSIVRGVGKERLITWAPKRLPKPRPRVKPLQWTPPPRPKPKPRQRRVMTRPLLRSVSSIRSVVSVSSSSASQTQTVQLLEQGGDPVTLVPNR